VSRPQLLPAGEHAVLVELASLTEVLAAAAWIRSAVADHHPGFTEVLDVVPAARTVLVTLGERGDLQQLRSGIGQLSRLDLATPDPRQPAPSQLTPSQLTPSTTVEIPVHYDGPDLAEVATQTGLSEAEVIDAHTGTSWQAAFGGFAPGFSYLVGGDQRLQVPRRAEPRTSVPAGAVALAGEFSAIYPRSSPGGWQLIGHTDTQVWDLAREPAALLEPGVTVRFRRAR